MLDSPAVLEMVNSLLNQSGNLQQDVEDAQVTLLNRDANTKGLAGPVTDSSVTVMQGGKTGVSLLHWAPIAFLAEVPRFSCRLSAVQGWRGGSGLM